MRTQIHVVGAIIVRSTPAGPEVLCAQRGAGMALTGLWEFPGGKVEPGETEQAALAREITEELLCAVEVGAHVDTTTHAYDFGDVTLATYYATLTHGEPQATEHAAVRWVAASDLASLDWAPADLSAVAKVTRDLVVRRMTPARRSGALTIPPVTSERSSREILNEIRGDR